MKYVDRLKFSATGTNAATIASGAAATACRSLAQAIADGDVAVGEANVPFTTTDGTAWETSLYTITSTTVITRTRVLSSSAGGLAPATFSGPLSVFNAVPGSHYSAGFVNPDDAGFDIVLCAGQSNMVGQGAVSTFQDPVDPRVFQFGSASADTNSYQLIGAATDPLRHPNNDAQLGPSTWFARVYAGMIPQNRKVLLVPVGWGGTAIGNATTPGRWFPGSPGGDLYEMAISQANAALLAAKAMLPASRVVGTIWMQGETDGDNSLTQTDYAAGLTAIVAGFRARITGASSSWFVIGGLIPNGLSAKAPWRSIQSAQQQVAANVVRTSYFDGPSGAQYGDAIHYNAAGQRILGSRFALAVPAAKANSGAVIPATLVQLTGPTSGVVNTASSAFTVSTDGTRSAPVVVTPTPVAGVTFSPSSVTLPAGTASGTFTATSTGTGTVSVAVTNNAGLPNPSAISFVVAAAATVPGAPTIGIATPGDTTASVTFTPPASTGGAAIIDYTVTAVPTSGTTVTATGASSPINVTGLVDGIAYTFTVKARNSVGSSSASGSTTATPAAVVVYPDLVSTSSITKSGTGPYTYTGNVTSPGGGAGGIFNKSLPANTDGGVIVKIVKENVSTIGFITGSSIVASTASIPYCFDRSSQGNVYTVLASGAIQPLNGVPSVTAGDYVKVERIGSTFKLSVSRDQGQSWMYTQSVAMSAGAFNIEMLLAYDASYQLISQFGLV